MRWALAAAFGSVGCLVAAYVTRKPDLDGWISYAPLDDESEGTLSAPIVAELSGSAFDPFDWGNPYLWLGAGSALALVAIVVLFVGRFGRG